MPANLLLSLEWLIVREYQNWHLFGPCKPFRLCEEVGKGHEEDQGQIGEKEN